MKKLLAISALFLSTNAFGVVSQSMSLVTDFVWRGQSQTSHNPAIQGGINYDFNQNFGLGTWISNVGVSNADGSVSLTVMACATMLPALEKATV